MTASFRLLILSAAVLSMTGLASVAQAQGVDAAPRNTVRVDQNGYATLETPTSRGDSDFALKAKVVAEAKAKKEAKQVRDQQALPGLKQPSIKANQGPPA